MMESHASLERLDRLIGNEHDVAEVARELYNVAFEFHASCVGAMHLTCSDESEQECTDAFRQRFAEYLLPSLKFGARSVFRVSNLGGRYEWGAAAIAEDHYAIDDPEGGSKLMVVKINSHVSVENVADGIHFGRMDRYGRESVYCGALHALLEGDSRPFSDDLGEAFASEGKDRRAVLVEEQSVLPAHRGLFAALVNARVQARRALVDIQDHHPATPTLYLVLPCVTLNRRRDDTEILCGRYFADWRGDDPVVTYRGLGDDPGAYRLLEEGGPFRVEDDQIDVTREARNHREHIRQEWQRAAPEPPDSLPPELDNLVQETVGKKHHDPHYARQMLKIAVRAAAQFNPVSGAVMMFSEGIADIHHLFRVHRIARGLAEDREAQRVLEEIEDKVDHIPPDRARMIIEMLAEYYAPGAFK